MPINLQDFAWFTAFMFDTLGARLLHERPMAVRFCGFALSSVLGYGPARRLHDGPNEEAGNLMAILALVALATWTAVQLYRYDT
jgi:hypothetical protein